MTPRDIFRWILHGAADYKSSTGALLAANALPLFGVLFLGWDAFAVVVLYWAENLIIGAINVLKMITCSPDPNEVDLSQFTDENIDKKIDEKDAADAKTALRQFGLKTAAPLVALHAAKFFIIPFFIFHYGMFCLVHGVFVFAMFSMEDKGAIPDTFRGQIEYLAGDKYLIAGILALAASHLYSFFSNYIGRGEYRRTMLPALMVQPYGRIIVLHIAILFGGFVVMSLGSPIGLLILLVVGKTILDLTLHLRERAKNATPPATAPPRQPPPASSDA